MNAVVKILGSAIIIACLVFLVSLIPIREATLGPIENIHGIPFPKNNGGTVITEELAHADVYLNEPVLAKNLFLIIDFESGNLTSLSVGVREDSFWLSYGNRQEFYSTIHDPQSHNPIIIPLTDKLQETDRSVDLMFFAEAPAGQEPLWELRDIQIETQFSDVTYPQFRNYIGSILKRERAL